MALYVISVGGSLIVPDGIDSNFLNVFKQFIIRRIEKGDRFILIAGGGKTARKYQESAALISGIDNEEKDWIGIHSTRLNAHLLRTIFKLWANPRVIKHYDEESLDSISFNEKILVGAGWKPGWSTDYDAILIAKKFNATSVINLSNTDYVYSEDPRVNPEAKKYTSISWKEFKDLVGSKWDPGMSAPFDPIASNEASKSNIKVIIMNGKNISNINDYMDGKKFKGTTIS